MRCLFLVTKLLSLYSYNELGDYIGGAAVCIDSEWFSAKVGHISKIIILYVFFGSNYLGIFPMVYFY